MEPARLLRLGADRDEADGDLLTAMLHATSAWRARTGLTQPTKPLRELVWFTWQQPRLPKPLVRSKYPEQAPWTEAARLALAQDARARLVIEHVEPVSVVLTKLLALATAGALTPAMTCNELYAAGSFAVVTADEDKALTRAGVRGSAPHLDDPWSRYRAAGIDVSRLAPLSR